MNRTRELLQRYLDQIASQAELAELDRCLRTSPEAADAFVAAGRMDLGLQDHFQGQAGIRDVLLLAGEPAETESGNRKSVRRRRMLRPGYVAAAVVLLTLAGPLFYWLDRAAGAPAEVVSGQVLVDGVRADRIPDGARFEVTGSTAAVIRLADGSRAELNPTSQAVLRKRLIVLNQGSGTFLVARGDRRFRVETAAGSVWATDTTFSVELRSDQEPEEEEPMHPKATLALVVAVMLGQVEVDCSGQKRVVSLGESRVFAADKPDGGKKQVISGKVAAVAADGRSFVVEGKPAKDGLPAGRSEVKLTDRTSVTYFGVERGADRLTVGYTVAAFLVDGSPDTAEQVVVGSRQPSLSGRVQAVAADGRTITIEIPSKTGPATTAQVQLTERTRLDYQGVANEEDRKPTIGHGAQVWLVMGSKDAAAEVQFFSKGAGKESPAEVQLTGKITAVAPDGSSITLETASKSGTPGQATIKLAPETRLASVNGDKDSKPAVGQVAVVVLARGSRDTAAVVKFGISQDGEKKPEPKKPEADPKKPEIKKPDPKKPEQEPKKPEIKKPEADPKKPEIKQPDPKKPEGNPKVGNLNKEGDSRLLIVPGDPGNVARIQATAAAIDQEIDRRLAAAKVPASPRADDAEFLRRVTLDITGRLPTHARTVAFLDSTDADKRVQLVNELLASQAYGQHFGTIWKNRIAPRDTSTTKFGADVFGPYMAEQFNRNRGWDRIVYDLLTAEGAINGNPQARFIMANSENQQPRATLLADATTRLFLGVQLQWPQCHDHPFAAWKQADYWSTAAFFSRLRNTSNKDQREATLTEAPGQAIPTGTKGDPMQPAAEFGSIVIPTSGGKGAGKVVKARFLGGDEPVWTVNEPLRPRFAAWATAPDNPYFAVAAVNRLWAHFLGRGLINPVDNIHENNPPSHPELLDVLAEEFRRSGFDQKHLIRCICTSAAYQRTSRPVAGNAADSELFSHMAVKVMSPEVLYDALAQVTTPRSGGKPEPREPFLNFFTTAPDASPMEYAHGIPQLLRLMNGSQANPSAGLIDQWNAAGWDRDRIIEGLYLATLSRRPTAEEAQIMKDYAARRPDSRTAWDGVLWILLNSSEFVLNR